MKKIAITMPSISFTTIFVNSVAGEELQVKWNRP